MASPGNQTTTLFATTQSSITTTQQSPFMKHHQLVLVYIYTVVLVSGITGVFLMAQILWSSVKSLTTISVINLIFAHFIFLLTVPFRIHYYATNCWSLGSGWCKTVSSMIHVHMYMVFIFYVIILVTRLLTFYHKTRQTEFYWKRQALVVSVLLWLLVITVVPCIIFNLYGVDGSKSNSTGQFEVRAEPKKEHCFHFGKFDEGSYITVFNYIISIVIIVVTVALTALQAKVLAVLRRRYSKEWASQQVFWAHLKSLFFALIMTVCFVPYHMFRLYYIGNLDTNKHLEDINEVFLSITSLICLDMLTFMGRGTFFICCKGHAS